MNLDKDIQHLEASPDLRMLAAVLLGAVAAVVSLYAHDRGWMIPALAGGAVWTILWIAAGLAVLFPDDGTPREGRGCRK